MNEIFVCGSGAVSPAGYGVAPFRESLARGQPIPACDLQCPGWTHPLQVRSVPPPSPRPAFLSHPRLRRTSPVAQHTVAAALEALGDHASRHANGSERLGVLVCVMSGCVNYSRRFYDETLKEPATASPLVFPETVFNAPASHLAALLGTAAINYTLVGDPGTFLQAIALAADWLLNDRVDACLVIGSEEMDWLTAEAFHLFDRSIVLGEGSGALYLRRETNQSPPIRLRAITQPQLFSNQQTRAQAAKRVRASLGPPDKAELLCDGLQRSSRIDRAEAAAWLDWPGPRLSPKIVLGEGMMAAAAWQCVAAIEAIRRGQSSTATVSVVGSNEQAIAARFIKNT